MLRLKILVSVVPLIAAAIFARVEFFSGPGPCIALGANTLEMASAPWNADLHVSFTDDPALATVRVAITDDPATADYTVIDDADDNENTSCEATPTTRFVAVSAHPGGSAPVIYLSRNGPADYRIFVDSKRLSPREAAALIVGAHHTPPRLAAAL